jgi:hypothetical protein
LVLPGGITVPGAVAMKSIPPITDQLSAMLKTAISVAAV